VSNTVTDVSACISKFWIPCLIFFYFHIFCIFWISITILSYTLISPVLQLQSQQIMTSQIRLHIYYLTQTYNILVLISFSELMKNLASLTVFKAISWRCLIVTYFLGHPVYCVLQPFHCTKSWSDFVRRIDSSDTKLRNFYSAQDDDEIRWLINYRRTSSVTLSSSFCGRKRSNGIWSRLCWHSKITAPNCLWTSHRQSQSSTQPGWIWCFLIVLVSLDDGW